MKIEITWCIDNPEEAIKEFGEIRKELPEWERELNRRKEDEKEFTESYLEIGKLIKKFGDSYSEVVATNTTLKSVKESHSMGDVTSNNYLGHKSKLNKKLTVSFQSLIDTHAEILNMYRLLSPSTKLEEEITEDFIDREEKGKHDLKSQIESLKEELDKLKLLLASSKQDYYGLREKLDAAMVEVDLSCVEQLKEYKIIK